MKWSKSAALLATVIVLLVAFVFVKVAHANSLNHVNSTLYQTQQEASKIKTQLVESEKETEVLQKEIQVRDEKVQQLEQENADLKG